MSASIDLTDAVFERLTVIARDLNPPKDTRQFWWICQCICGQTVSVRSSQLRKGRTRSCGCLRQEQPPANLLDLTGQSFERLTVLERDPFPKHPEQGASWICKCICGTQVSVIAKKLRSKQTRSCGCWEREHQAEGNLKHGNARRGKITPEYQAWKKMKERCLSPASPDYPRYGGRGITISQVWIDSFETFFADVGVRPSPQHSLERRDNEGPYGPENCRWATRIEQARNTRNNVFLIWKNETHCISEWAEILHVPERRIAERYRANWPVERILTEPPRRWPSQQ